VGCSHKSQSPLHRSHQYFPPFSWSPAWGRDGSPSAAAHLDTSWCEFKINRTERDLLCTTDPPALLGARYGWRRRERLPECEQSHRAEGWEHTHRKKKSMWDDGWRTSGQKELWLKQCPNLQSCNVCDHVGKKCIAGDVEWYSQTHITWALVQLTRQLAVAHVELTESVAGGQSHEGQVCNVRRHKC